jgi:hypothetical protein
MELTPLLYQKDWFHVFEKSHSFGYYESKPFEALRSFLRTIGPVNANKLQCVMIWHEESTYLSPAPSSLSLIHKLNSTCQVFTPAANTMNN